MQPLTNIVKSEVWLLFFIFLFAITIPLIFKLPRFVRSFSLNRDSFSLIPISGFAVTTTILVATYYVLLLLKDPTHFPDVPEWMLVILGLSNTVNIGHKMLVRNQRSKGFQIK